LELPRGYNKRSGQNKESFLEDDFPGLEKDLERDFFSRMASRNRTHR